MPNENDFTNRTVKIERVFDAPIELVWEAWTNPKHIAKWWNPSGSETTIEKHEFKVDGEWRYSMPMPNGKTFIAEGVYVEIVHHERICSKAEFKPMTTGVEIQSLFKAANEKTEFTFNVVHQTVEYKMQQEKMGIQNGWGSVFGRLDEYLVEIK